MITLLARRIYDQIYDNIYTFTDVCYLIELIVSATQLKLYFKLANKRVLLFYITRNK